MEVKPGQNQKSKVNLLNQCKKKCIRTLLKLPNSTPIPAVTGETGLLLLKYIIQQNQLNFLYRLKRLQDTRLVRQNQYYAYNNNNCTNHMNTLLNKYKINQEEILNYTSKEWSKHIQELTIQDANRTYDKDVTNYQNLNQYGNSK